MDISELSSQFLPDGCQVIQLPLSPEMVDAILQWRKENMPDQPDSNDGVSLVAGAWWLLVASLIEPVFPHGNLTEALNYCEAESIDCQEYFKKQIPAAMAEYLRILDSARLMKKYRLKVTHSDGGEPSADVPVSRKDAPTLAGVISDLLAAKKSLRMSEAYIGSLRQYLAAFAKGRENLKINAIRSIDIDQWFSGRQEAPVTRNSNLGRLSALFSFAWRKGYIGENPCLKVEKLRVERKSPAHLSVEQCQAILEYTERDNPRFLGWLALCLFVGLRPESEADIITWDEIDIDRQRIRIDSAKTKTHRARIVDLNQCPPAAAWLTRAKEVGSELPIPHTPRRRYLRKLRDALKLEEWPQDILRHTAATYLFARHQDAGKVAAFLGNSADILLRHYRALANQEEANRFFAIRPSL